MLISRHYLVIDHPDIICIKLANGATIWLEVEDNASSNSDTFFVEGKYSLKCLTEIQNKISAAMQKKELLFVTVSYVDEISTCIKISVTTGDETQLKKLHQFDDIGGAIKVDYTTGESIKE